MKKALSMILAIIMLLSVFSVSSSAAITLAEGSDYTLSNYTAYDLKPSQSGWYTFNSYDNYGFDPRISVYPADDAGIGFEDDDGGYDWEFNLYCYLEKDETYEVYITDCDQAKGEIKFNILFRGTEYDSSYDGDYDDGYDDDYEEDYSPSEITFIPAEPIVLRPYIDGYYEGCSCSGCQDGWFFVYDVYDSVYSEGNKLVLHFENSTTITFTCDEFGEYYSDDGECIDFFVDDDQYSSHWESGKTYTVAIQIGNATTYFQVQIAEAPEIKSATYNTQKPLKLIENLDGHWDWDNNDNEYFFYYVENVLVDAGKSITIEFENGDKLDFTCGNDSIFYHPDYGYYMPYAFFDNQYSNHWRAGRTYYVTLVFMGETLHVPISIVENNVASISFVPAKAIDCIYNVDGDMCFDDFGDTFFAYDYYDKVYAIGSYLNVEYKDGSVEKYYYNEDTDMFESSTGENIEFLLDDEQYENHWYPGRIYYASLRAFGKECKIPVEIIYDKPATPKVTTTNEIGGVKINWNKVEGAVKYNVYRRQGGYSTWTLVGTTTGNTLLDKNVKSGIYYVYSVRAYNAQGKYSDFVSANTQTRKYMATPKLTTIYNHQNGLAIKWNAVAGVTKGYRVYRRGAGSTYWTYLGTTKNLYFIDNAVKNKSGEYFRYTVIADGGYHSKFDTTGLYLRRLANPTLNSAVSSKSGITVKWGKVAGSSGYYVYRKTANSTWTRIAVVKGVNGLSYLDKTAKKGVTYTYTVRAVYGNTLSSYYSGISCKDKY